MIMRRDTLNIGKFIFFKRVSLFMLFRPYFCNKCNRGFYRHYIKEKHQLKCTGGQTLKKKISPSDIIPQPISSLNHEESSISKISRSNSSLYLPIFKVERSK